MNDDQTPRYISYPDGNISYSYEMAAPNAENSQYNENSYIPSLSYQQQQYQSQIAQDPVSPVLQNAASISSDSIINKYQNNPPTKPYHAFEPKINTSLFPEITGLPPQSQIFYNRLQELARSKNRDLRKAPRVGRKELDLFKLYSSVQKRGGYNNITQWKDLAIDLELPMSVTNAGYTLRTKYESFILPFEQQLLIEFPLRNGQNSNQLVSYQSEQKNAILTQQKIQNMMKQEYMNKIMQSQMQKGDIQSALETKIKLDTMKQYSLNKQFADQQYGDQQYVDQQKINNQITQLTQLIDKANDNINNLNKQQTNEQQTTNITQYNPQQQFFDNSFYQQQNSFVYNPQQLALTHQKTSTLKKLKMDQHVFDDDKFLKILLQYPLLESLEIGSLKNLTRAPTQFPKNLKFVRLNEVPKHLVDKFMEILNNFQLEELEVNAYNEVNNDVKTCSMD